MQQINTYECGVNILVNTQQAIVYILQIEITLWKKHSYKNDINTEYTSFK